MNDSSWSVFVVLCVLVSFIVVGLKQKSRDSVESASAGATPEGSAGSAIASN